MHGGGFYHPQKYLVAPAALPAHLHWFYWESYSTWLTGFVYSHTQSKIHVIVTHGFLRSLARLELEESAVGRFASEDRRGVRREKDGAITVGETPWGWIAALAAAGVAALVGLVLWLTRD